MEVSSNEFFKKLVSGEGKVTNFGAALSGALVGVSETAINCPFEVVKVRMQAKDNVGLYKNTLDCAKQLVKAEGIAGIFRGAEPQCWRSGIWNMAYFGLIGSVRNAYQPPANSPHSQIVITKMLTGSVSGAIATSFATPFDVVKSRFQNQLPGQVRRYNWAVPSLIDIYRTEGFRACYKGYAARMARLVPGGGIMLVAFDYVTELLEPY
jgi:solute carrier family 25 2-oxodicarboxylate transporter 21